MSNVNFYLLETPKESRRFTVTDSVFYDSFFMNDYDTYTASQCLYGTCKYNEFPIPERDFFSMYDRELDNRYKHIALVNEDKEIIKKFMSITAAARELGIDKNAISRVLCGVTKSTIDGYKFIYLY